MLASGGKIGSLAAVAFALMCHLNAYGALIVDTVDNSGNNVIKVAPGDSFTIDILIEDDGMPGSPLAGFENVSTSAQISGISQGVSFVDPQPTELYFGFPGAAFGKDPDYAFVAETFGPLVAVVSSDYLNDTAIASDTVFPAKDISNGGTKLLARFDLIVSPLATLGDVYQIDPIVELRDPLFQLFPPDSITAATIQVVAVPEASSFIGWALMGVTMCGVVWWRRSR